MGERAGAGQSSQVLGQAVPACPGYRGCRSAGREGWLRSGEGRWRLPGSWGPHVRQGLCLAAKERTAGEDSDTQPFTCQGGQGAQAGAARAAALLLPWGTHWAGRWVSCGPFHSLRQSAGRASNVWGQGLCRGKGQSISPRPVATTCRPGSQSKVTQKCLPWQE